MAANYYSNCSTITTGCYLYNNTCLTSPASSGFYSDGSNCFTISSGGYISSVTACPTGVYYVYADKYQCPGFGFGCEFTGITEIIASYSQMFSGTWWAQDNPYDSVNPAAYSWQSQFSTTDPGYAVPFMFYGSYGFCPLQCGFV